jgi:hypothetical protein
MRFRGRGTRGARAPSPRAIQKASKNLSRAMDGKIERRFRPDRCEIRMPRPSSPTRKGRIWLRNNPE